MFRLDFTSLRSTKRILDYLEQAGIDAARVRLVINRYGQAKELPLSQAEEALGRKIVFLIPDDPKTINAANNAGEPAVFRTPSAKVAQSIVQLGERSNQSRWRQIVVGSSGGQRRQWLAGRVSWLILV